MQRTRRATAWTVATLGAAMLVACGAEVGTLGQGGSASVQGKSPAAAKPRTLKANEARTLDGVRLAHDVILNNLANAQTPGFQAVRPIFEAVEADGAGQALVMLPVMHRDPSPGVPVETRRWLDVAIEGNGYLIVDDPAAGADNGLTFTRAGELHLSRQGELVVGSPDGPRLEPAIVFPDRYRDIRIESDGTVRVQPMDAASWMAVGQIHLCRFSNAAGLKRTAAGRFLATPESGQPLVDVPGSLGLGTLRQKHLEGSNVDVAGELAELQHLTTWGQALAGSLGVDANFDDRPTMPAVPAVEAARHASPAPEHEHDGEVTQVSAHGMPLY